MASKQPEALRLADELEDEFTQWRISNHTGRKAATELLRQHARIAELEAQIEAIGAGGVSGPLMGCASIAASAGSEPVATVFTMDAQAIPGVQWQCGPQASGFTAHQADSQPARDERDDFEKTFPLPSGCIRVGTGYASTDYSNWAAHTHVERWEGWRARAARAPADSVTAPVGGETYHLGACIVEDMLHATVMRKEPGRAGAVTVLLSEQIPVEHLQDRDVIVNATPPFQTADSVLEDAARLDWLLLHISGAEFRRIGVHYSGNAGRADVDAARKQGGA